MTTVYKISTGEYVKTDNPLVLTVIDAEALQLEDSFADVLVQELGADFAKGRPGDRQPKKPA